MKFILGKKIEMTQLWKDNEYVAVTKVQAGPCAVAQVKTKDKDGYSAVQIVFDTKKEKNINKAQIGHLKKAGLSSAKYAREFRIDDSLEIKSGNIIKTDTFAAGDVINVSGVSKGKGFAGVVKRHGFAGSKKTHGNKDQLRMPGSIGATGPAHVFKGTRMGGRMGGDKVTVLNAEVVEVDSQNNLLFIKGAVPGARNSLVAVVGQGDLTISDKRQETSDKEVGDKDASDKRQETGDKDASDKQPETGDKDISDQQPGTSDKEDSDKKPETSDKQPETSDKQGEVEDKTK